MVINVCPVFCNSLFLPICTQPSVPQLTLALDQLFAGLTTSVASLQRNTISMNDHRPLVIGYPPLLESYGIVTKCLLRLLHYKYCRRG